MTKHIPPIVVMGVQGSGKSTIASLLAERLGLQYIDGDDLHSAQNKARMAAGHPLTDEQRKPWLNEIGRRLAADDGLVIVCSALKRSYRDLLREYAPDLYLVFLRGDQDVIAERISRRNHEYMPPSLLSSQFAELEEPEADEAGIAVDIRHSQEEIVAQVSDHLGSGIQGRA